MSNYQCMVKPKTISSNVQLSLFPCQGSSVKDTQKGCAPSSQVINSYLSTREGLFRLLSCFPGNMPVGEAVRRAYLMFRGGKEVAV